MAEPSAVILSHPEEDIGSVREAISTAIRRTRERGLGGEAVILSARGEGGADGAPHIVEVGFRAGILFLHTPLSEVLIAVHKAGLEGIPTEEVAGVSRCTVRNRDPEEVAALLDCYYRETMAVRPLVGADSYGFRAELD